MSTGTVGIITIRISRTISKRIFRKKNHGKPFEIIAGTSSPEELLNAIQKKLMKVFLKELLNKIQQEFFNNLIEWFLNEHSEKVF